ncbi:hypothetical protein L1987_60144 [Smallanthus sonchifolius]|uniref:Uncharacterized protein n=1 Tax=Smallanthus sonchifolius TaxID=185202 RepID=A0ACB9D7L7_9ASTR|nr:hypothetical protein L1987_60144 [Smallanthus sonchifolius]
MAFGNREFNLDMLTKSFTYFSKFKFSKAGKTNKCPPRSKLDEGGPNENVLIVDRFELKNEVTEVVDAATHKCGDDGIQMGKPPWKNQVESANEEEFNVVEQTWNPKLNGDDYHRACAAFAQVWGHSRNAEACANAMGTMHHSLRGRILCVEFVES